MRQQQSEGSSRVHRCRGDDGSGTARAHLDPTKTLQDGGTSEAAAAAGLEGEQGTVRLVPPELTPTLRIRCRMAVPAGGFTKCSQGGLYDWYRRLVPTGKGVEGANGR